MRVHSLKIFTYRSGVGTLWIEKEHISLIEILFIKHSESYVNSEEHATYRTVISRQNIDYR